MLQNNLEANQVKIGDGLSPTPLNPVVDEAYLGTSSMLAPARPRMSRNRSPLVLECHNSRKLLHC